MGQNCVQNNASVRVLSADLVGHKAKGLFIYERLR